MAQFHQMPRQAMPVRYTAVNSRVNIYVINYTCVPWAIQYSEFLLESLFFSPVSTLPKACESPSSQLMETHLIVFILFSVCYLLRAALISIFMLAMEEITTSNVTGIIHNDKPT